MVIADIAVGREGERDDERAASPPNVEELDFN